MTSDKIKHGIAAVPDNETQAKSQVQMVSNGKLLAWLENRDLLTATSTAVPYEESLRTADTLWNKIVFQAVSRMNRDYKNVIPIFFTPFMEQRTDDEENAYDIIGCYEEIMRSNLLLMAVRDIATAKGYTEICHEMNLYLNSGIKCNKQLYRFLPHPVDAPMFAFIMKGGALDIDIESGQPGYNVWSVYRHFYEHLMSAPVEPTDYNYFLSLVVETLSDAVVTIISI